MNLRSLASEASTFARLSYTLSKLVRTASVSNRRPLGYRPTAQSRYASRQWWAGEESNLSPEGHGFTDRLPEPPAFPSRYMVLPPGTDPGFSAYQAIALRLDDRSVAERPSFEPDALRHNWISTPLQRPCCLHAPSGGERVVSIAMPCGTIRLRTGGGSRPASLSKLADDRGPDLTPAKAPTGFRPVSGARRVDHPSWCSVRDSNPSLPCS